MKKLALLSLALMSILACKNTTKVETDLGTKEENTVEEVVENPILETGCYEYSSDGNTIKMEITELNTQVKGNLDIAYSGKDSNKGKFIGNLNGDKLIGTYTFNAEGKESSREIAFLVKDNQIVEGYGELTDNGAKFKDTSAIKYTATMPLTKVDCSK
jgi:cyclophilin family peptidyl-prolyl cis-trans isomerase